ncbi:hypothetical protein E3Q14_02681 [Wallemia mellicola]|nr:hypothetical protein E3Q14_02681 [Wallemia mellicola]
MSSKTELVKLLRNTYNCSITQAMAALKDGNYDLTSSKKAIETILERDSTKKAEKALNRGVGSEGLIGTIILNSGFPITTGVPALNRARGGILQVNCETDFVARTTNFKQLVQDVSHTLAFLNESNGFKDIDLNGDILSAPLIQSNPDSTPSTSSNTSIKDAITQTIANVGENITLQRFSGFSLNPATDKSSPFRLLGQFTHNKLQNESNSPVELGTLAGLIDLEVSNTSNESTASSLAKKIARQSVAIPSETLEDFNSQELLGGAEGESVLDHLKSMDAKILDFKRWSIK